MLKINKIKRKKEEEKPIAGWINKRNKLRGENCKPVG